MNTKLLRRIQREILKEPRRFDMRSFIDITAPQAPCRTAACIAGWALVITSATDAPITETTFPRLARQVRAAEEKRMRQDEEAGESYEGQAKKVLGLTGPQATRLFYHGAWSRALYRPYVSALLGGDYAKAARIACSRIDHFIKTKGRE